MNGPLPSTSGAPLGERHYWELVEKSLLGDNIRARIAKPGGDWMQVGLDGHWRPDVRVALVTDDGETILLRYFGLVRPDERFLAAAGAGAATDYGDQYLRQFMTFETGAARYMWLTQSLFIADGRLAAPGELEYDVYRVL